MRHNEHRTMDLSPASDDADAPDPTGPDAPAPRYPHRDRDAGWVVASLSGDPAAFGHLYDAWFDKAYDVALRINRDRDVAAEVAQDAFLSAWRNLGSLEDPGTFGGWILRIARNGAYNRQRKEQRSQPVDDRGLAVIEAVGASPTSAPQGFGVEDRLSASSDPSRAMEDAELADLVWDAAGALGARDVEVLDLQLRHGLSPAEIGEVVGLNRNAANQLVHRVRKRLDAAIRARVLWRGGTPACPDLDRLLRSAGIAAFDAEAVKLADTHAASCEACSDRRQLKLQPSALFASVPIVVAPIFIKTQAASALEALGVPMQGSSFAGGGAAGAGATAGEAAGDAGGGAAGAGAAGDGSVLPRPEPASAGRSWRTAALGVAAAVVLVALLFGITGRLGPGLNEEQVASQVPVTTATPGTEPAGSSVPPTFGVEPGDTTPATDSTSSTTLAGTPPSSGATTPTIVVVPTDPTTVTNPTTPPPTATNPTTPPTTPVPVQISLAIKDQRPFPYTATWYLQPPSSTAPATAPLLVWTVTGPAGMTIDVSGVQWSQLDVAATNRVFSHNATGNEALCPGTVLRSVLCSGVKQGTYTYTVTVTTPGGAKTSKSVDLVVTAPPVP